MLNVASKKRKGTRILPKISSMLTQKKLCEKKKKTS